MRFLPKVGHSEILKKVHYISSLALKGFLYPLGCQRDKALVYVKNVNLATLRNVNIFATAAGHARSH